ncbi:hypothetical protein F5Y19DRAFT_337949 [Xylariaceae sp. FL1651]|nr:hypothetical protein F5Y19DRAFT_337949 [Xylariaceae sp. FL1651]
MSSTKWLKQKNTFGSKSIAFRPKPWQETSAATRWRPRGPFRLFDLPPELRIQILNTALLDCESHKQVVQIFLACQRLYTETASIFYDEVWLDITNRSSPPPLFAEPITPLSPRLHVRRIVLKLYPKDNLRSFNELYVPVLRDMASQGNLRVLQLQINGRFPGMDFWTDHYSNEDDFCETEIPLLVGPDMRIEYLASAFVVAPPFQSFLDFLAEPGVPKVSLHIDSFDHYRFWCLLHRKHPSGLQCHGLWPGKAKRLKVNQKSLIRLFRGARAVQPLNTATLPQLVGNAARIT